MFRYSNGDTFQIVSSVGRWHVIITTSELLDSGSHANVFLTICGASANSERFDLKMLSTDSEPFESGKESEFDVS